MTPLFAAASVYWHLPILLVVFSLVYSATRHDRWDRILWEAGGWVVRMATFLVGIAVGLYVFSSYPDYWPYLAGAAAAVAVFVMYVLPALTKKPTPPPANSTANVPK